MKKYFSLNEMKILYSFFASFFAFFYLFLLLLIFHFQKIHFAALGSSALAVFALSKAKSSSNKNIIGSYILAIFIGMFFSYFLHILHLHHTIFYESLFAALAVTFTIALEILFSYEHPPSAGVALGLVVTSWNIWTIVSLFLAIGLLILYRKAIKKIFPKNNQQNS